MRDAWAVVAVVGAATVALKAAGPVLLGGRDLPAPVARVVVLLAPAVLTALVAVGIFGGERELVLDSRVLGLAAAAGALLARAQVILVVTAAALATALGRALV